MAYDSVRVVAKVYSKSKLESDGASALTDGGGFFTFTATTGSPSSDRFQDKTFDYFDYTSARVTVAAAASAGTTFKGWVWKNAKVIGSTNATASFDISGLYGDEPGIVLYALFSPASCTVTIQRHDDSGKTKSVTAKFGVAMPNLNVASFARAGFTLKGIFDQPLDNGKKYYNADGTPAVAVWDKTKDATLHAHWTAPLMIYNTETDSDGGKMSNKTTLSLVKRESGGNITYEELATEGADGILGWNKNKNAELRLICRPKDTDYYLVGFASTPGGAVLADDWSEERKNERYDGLIQRVLFSYASTLVGYLRFAKKPTCSLEVKKVITSESPIGTYGTVTYKRGGYDDDAKLLTGPDTGAKWYCGQLYVVVAPNEVNGVVRRITSWEIRGAGGGAVATGAYDKNGPLVFSFDTSEQSKTVEGVVRRPYLSENTTIVMGFGSAQWTVGAAKHSGSMSAISSVSVAHGGSSGDSLVVGDNENVTLSAVVASGYSFAGWYDASGSRKSGDASYTFPAKADVTLYAKAAVSVSVSFEDENGETVAGEFVTFSGGGWLGNGRAELGAEIGYSFDGSAQNVTWFIMGWYTAADTSHETPLDMGESGSITVNGNLSYVVVLSSDKPTRELTITAYNGSSVLNVSGFVSFDGEAATGTAGVATGERSGDGSMTAKVATPVVSPGGTALAFSGWQDAEGNPLSGAQLVSRTFVLNRDSSVRLVYVAQGNVQVTAAVAGDSERHGEAKVFQGDAESNENGNLTVLRGTTVTFVAVPTMNGYEFAGWYCGDELISEDGEYEHVVVEGVTLTARFRRTTNAVFEWEGSDENKMMRWRSKLYVASKVFNPAAARVDASVRRDEDGGETPTLAQFTVEVHSSPDADPTSSVTLQGMTVVRARRLPKMRPERYMAVEVQNDEQVDRIIVGTSMEGLAT